MSENNEMALLEKEVPEEKNEAAKKPETEDKTIDTASYGRNPDGKKNLFAIRYDKEYEGGSLDTEEFVSSWAGHKVYVNKLMVANRFPDQERHLLFPLFYYFFAWLFLIVGILSIIGYFGVREEWGKELANSDATTFIVLGAISITVYLVLLLIYILRRIYVMKHLPLIDPENTYPPIVRRRKTMGIPNSATNLDILILPYAVDKDGKERCYTPLTKVRYQNMQSWAYLEDGELNLGAYSFTMSLNLKNISVSEPSKEKYTFLGWNKTVQPSEEKFKNSGLKWNPFGDFRSPVIKLTVKGKGGEYEILVPKYEEDSLKRLLAGEKIS